MLPWLSILRSALDAEYAERPRIATLATIDFDRQPRARTVILRRVDDEGALWIGSDGKSDKNAHLRNMSDAELVLYLPTSREQFRIFGRCRVIGRGDDEPFRQQFWLSLSDPARAMFFWPTVEQPVSGNQSVPTALPATTPMPDNFELIALRPEQVEHLTTAQIPHRRTRYRKFSAWSPESINP
jgi:PPOX class probable FMN-dependent enzyme